MQKAKYAVIKKDAAAIFARKINKMIRPDAPWTKEWSSFYNTLKELGGKKMKIEKVYDNRIYLKYTKPRTENGMKIVGIDLDRSLVTIKR